MRALALAPVGHDTNLAHRTRPNTPRRCSAGRRRAMLGSGSATGVRHPRPNAAAAAAAVAAKCAPISTELIRERSRARLLAHCLVARNGIRNAWSALCDLFCTCEYFRQLILRRQPDRLAAAAQRLYCGVWLCQVAALARESVARQMQNS